MNKKIFTGLVFLMGISILGIIAVQLIWINNALKVKNELFSRGVTEALNNSVTRLEHLHELTVFNKMVFSDSISKGKWIGIPPPPPAPRIVKGHKLNGRTIGYVEAIATSDCDTKMQLFADTGKSGTNVIRYEITTSSSGNKIKRYPGTTTGRQVIVFSNNKPIGNLDSLYNHGKVRIDSVVTHLDTISIGIPDFRKRVGLKAVRLKEMANQVVTEINTWDVKDVDFTLVGKVMKEEFESNNIPLQFEYGIYKDSVLTDRTKNCDTLKLTTSLFQANLYPNDIIQKNLKLSVYFPGKDSFILRSLNWLLSASFLFSLIILATFSLSIFFILRQKKISEMKSDFINNMTHEFKTPIATISVAVDSITNEKVITDQDKIRFFAGMIKKENTRMNRQVEDILTIARLDKKEFEFSWEPINIHELTDDVIQSILLQVEKRGGKIGKSFTAVNPVVTSDKSHFANMVYNLLDNANKYSSETPEITVSTKNSSKGIVISVEDKGIGMSKSVQSRIFERFYRQTSGNIHNVKGFGLGLNYVKAVVEANQGTISVHSEAGKGSRFDVFLPFLRG